MMPYITEAVPYFIPP